MREFITKKCSLTLRITVFKRMSLCGGFYCHVRKAGPPVARSASPRTFLSNSPQPRRPVKNTITPSLPARRAMTGLSYTHITPKREPAGFVDSPRLYSRRASHPQKTAPQARTPSRPLFIHRENIFPAYRPP